MGGGREIREDRGCHALPEGPAGRNQGVVLAVAALGRVNVKIDSDRSHPAPPRARHRGVPPPFVAARAESIRVRPAPNAARTHDAELSGRRARCQGPFRPRLRIKLVLSAHFAGDKVQIAFKRAWGGSFTVDRAARTGRDSGARQESSSSNLGVAQTRKRRLSWRPVVVARRREAAPEAGADLHHVPHPLAEAEALPKRKGENRAW